MIDYMKDKVSRYCQENKDKGIEFNLYHVHKMLEEDSHFWHISAMLYGQWLRDTSSFEGQELSTQEW